MEGRALTSVPPWLGAVASICGRPPDAAWSAAEFGATFAMWLGMMLAMMVPIVLPWIVTLAGQQRSRAAAAMPLRVGLFVAGYLLVWSAAGVLATLLQWGLSAGGVLSAGALLAHPWGAAAAFVAVGAYQWTPLKGACLKHCQTPASYLLAHWRDGAAGAARMGASHGLHCVGCCWPLMALMLVTGAMSLLWMAAVGAFVLAEMYLPALKGLTRWAGAGLMALGLLIPVLA